ncbi:nucleoside diphosphate-linked moiety X motif 19 isoform X2 [Ceratitis capitata]|nr:nucleoside diphosphate-linked moiety X motif 19 isoform X2 [Ceratitis capitata]
MDYIKTSSQSSDLNSLQCNAPRPNIYTKFIEDQIQRDISLRITAIRETFEETGILLCRQNDLNKGEINGFCHSFVDFDRHYWQNLVHNDPTQFLTLCKKFDVVPDLTALFDWTAWLTPVTFPKRFAAVFYLAALDHTPDVLLESNEAACFSWDTPMESIRQHLSNQINLHPPQFYELSRLLNFNRIHELIEFARVRSQKGVTLMFPIIQKCSDGTVSLMPGDDAYTESKELKTEDLTIEQYRLKATNLHRIEWFHTGKIAIQSDFPIGDGHLPPINVTTENESKL